MAHPVVSIIIPVYNTAPYLDRCVQSACGQTCDRIEIILVDDGSTDASPVLCDAYARSDERIRVIHKENGGLSDARNAGLRAARGEYILYVDSDDYMERTACENLIRYTDASPDLICGSYYCHEADGSVRLVEKDWFADGEVLDPKSYIIRSIQNRNIESMAWSWMYRRAFLLENGLFYRKGWLYEDLDLIFRMLLCADRIVSARSVMYHCVTRGDSITGSSCRWRNIHDSAGVLVHGMEAAENTRDPELQKYIRHNLIEAFMDSCKWRNFCGWRLLGINAGYAFVHVIGPKQKAKVLIREIEHIVRRACGNIICPGREFAETIAEEYVRKALLLYPEADAQVLHAADRLQKQGYAVTLVTCPEMPSDKKTQRVAGQCVREMREKGLRIEIAPLQKRGGSFLAGIRSAGILRRLLSNGYDIVLCGSKECLDLARKSGKIYERYGLTEFQLSR